MKIIQLSKYYPPTHGGLEVVAEFFSRACMDLGHDVKVISLGNDNQSYIGKYGEHVFQNKENIKLSSSPLSLDYFLKLKEIISKEKPDRLFVHLPHPFAHELCKWFKSELKLSGTKIIGIYHSDIINQVLLRDAYNVHFSRDLDMYDFFICASPDIKKSSSILSLLKDEQVKVIPFCIDPLVTEKKLKRTEKFSGSFVTIGRMVPYKGYEFLIDTFNSLPYQLSIVGGGPLKDKLKALAGPNIHFIGQVSEDQKYELMMSADALIMSSINRAEAYGMTIVEAFSIGLPVIASNIDTGVSFLVRDEQTGLKFPIKSKEGLTRQIEKLKSNPDLAKTISKNSFEFFNRELNFSAFKSNLERIL